MKLFQRLVTTLAVLVIAITAVLWSFSLNLDRKLRFTHGDTLWRVQTVQHQLRIERLRGWPEPEKATFASYPQHRSTYDEPDLVYIRGWGDFTRVGSGFGLYWVHGLRRVAVDSSGRIIRSNVYSPQFSPPMAYIMVDVPYWLPMLAPALFLAARWAIRLRGRRLAVARRRAGHCLNCGYDLRASPDRCPECGSAAGTSAGAIGVPHSGQRSADARRS